MRMGISAVVFAFAVWRFISTFPLSISSSISRQKPERLLPSVAVPKSMLAIPSSSYRTREPVYLIVIRMRLYAERPVGAHT